MVNVEMSKSTYIDLPTIGVTFANKEIPLVSNADRTVSIIASDETPIARFDWCEWQRYNLVLSHDPSHVNLSRIDNGVCMFLEDHQSSADYELGKFTGYTLENGRLELKAKLHPTEKADRYLAKCEAGTQPGNSVGINVYEMEVTKKAILDDDGRVITPATFTAISWELVECSSVSIPANPNAGVSQADKEEFSQLPKHRVLLHGDTGYTLTEDIKPVTKEETTNEAVQLANNLQRDLLSMTTERDQLLAKVTALELSLETAQSEVTTSRAAQHRFEVEKRYHGLKQKASGLLESFKMSRKEFDRYFSASENADVEKLSGNLGNVLMEECEAYLERVTEREEILPSQFKVTQPIENLATDTTEADSYLEASSKKPVKSY